MGELRKEPEDKTAVDTLIRVRQGTTPISFEYGKEWFEGKALTYHEELLLQVDVSKAISEFEKEHGVSVNELQEHVELQFWVRERLRRGICEGPEWWQKDGPDSDALSYDDLFNLFTAYKTAVSRPFR